jgi:hypothetical protein
MRRTRRQEKGQMIVVLALMIVVLTSAVGIGVDVGFGYIYSAACERAAAAAALAGVVFMPDQFDSTTASPSGSRNDASDRAIDEAKKNGFDVTNTADSIVVTPAAVTGAGNKLQVTVSRRVRTAFMQLFGLSSYTVSRSAIASYLPPLSVGQPGAQLGATVSQLGSTGFYFLRSEGFATPREQGDAFTPNPASEYGSSLSPPSTDVHQISYANGSEPVDSTLADRGGFNYRITLPAGGRIQVYNAAFSPEATHNFCENAKTGTAGHTCSSGDPYYYHEDDSFSSFGTNSNYSAMRYTVYQVPNLFIRSSDVEQTQMTVNPIDASNATASPPTYKDIGTGATITQTYNGAGAPTNMQIYHSWIDVATYHETGAGDLVTYNASHSALTGTLPAGTYRLRVDTLEWNGGIPNTSGSSNAHKGYAVRAVDTTGALCSACSVGAWNDTTLYTPVSGGTFSVPVLAVPPDYAGQTISLDIYDPGDLSVGSTLTLSILTPTGSVATATSPFQVKVYDLGTQRSNLESSTGCSLASPISNPPCLAASGSNATILSTSGGQQYFNGHWLHFLLPIPASYNPGTDPNNWWWKLQYATPAGTTANDTFSIAVGFKGNPAHLLQS